MTARDDQADEMPRQRAVGELVHGEVSDHMVDAVQWLS